jgi:hypothetical protein
LLLILSSSDKDEADEAAGGWDGDSISVGVSAGAGGGGREGAGGGGGGAGRFGAVNDGRRITDDESSGPTLEARLAGGRGGGGLTDGRGGKLLPLDGVEGELGSTLPNKLMLAELLRVIRGDESTGDRGESESDIIFQTLSFFLYTKLS